MKSAICKLVGVSRYSQGKHYSKQEVPEENGESYDNYERRTWRNRIHVTRDGYMYIPGNQIAEAVKIGAQYLSLKVKGKGNSTWTKNFRSGIMIIDGIKLPILAKDVPGEELFVPSNGQKGGGTRVPKIFPYVDEWVGIITAHIFDDSIIEEVFTEVLRCAGQLIGLGRYRPGVGGHYGRFGVESIEWRNEQQTMAAIGGVAS